MRVAILADIHGNFHALEAVLEDAARQGAERLIVNGDLVNRGPDNLRVLERLSDVAADFTLDYTLGNHDDLVRLWAARDAGLPQSWFDDPFWATTGWVAAQVAPYLPWLGTLPMTLRLELAGAPSVLIAHGSPRHYREGLGERTPEAAFSEILQDYPADVLVGSHIHRTARRRWGRHLILNTGAVGAPFDGDPRARYLLLTLEGGAWQPEFRAVPYDRDAALAAFETSGFLAAGGLSAQIFLEELRDARSYLTPFWMWSEERGLGQSWESWAQFRRAFPERFAAR